jgi:hypothetical protein
MYHWLFRLQGRCKSNAKSSLFAEAQPVLAISIAKLRTSSEIDISLEEKYVSNQEKLLFFPFHREKQG